MANCDNIASLNYLALAERWYQPIFALLTAIDLSANKTFCCVTTTSQEHIPELLAHDIPDISVKGDVSPEILLSLSSSLYSSLPPRLRQLLTLKTKQ